MSKKRETRLAKSSRIIASSHATQWCYVNTENEFEFLGTTFVISQDVKEYTVRNKSGETEDYTNEAYMEEILVALGDDHSLKFYNQHYDEVEQVFVRVKE